MLVTHLKTPAEVRNVIGHLPPVLKRKVRAALVEILEDPTAAKHSKRSLRETGVCRWQELASSIGLLHAPSRSSLSVPVKVSMKKQREKFAEVRRRGEFFYTRQGGRQQRGKDERYKPKIRKSNSRKKAALTLDING